MLSNVLAMQAARLRPSAHRIAAACAAVCAATHSRAASTASSGFNSPGNSNISEEMKEAGKPEGVTENEKATQMHQFSEKQRFDKQRFDNAQEGVGAAAVPSDTFSGGAEGPAEEGTPDEVMERRVSDPGTGGIAS